ncbi:MAG: hypothetical protein K0R50_4935 [Eubacterium sp.]|nr:hypothetical protein [Eubacterium sp.]
MKKIIRIILIFITFVIFISVLLSITPVKNVALKAFMGMFDVAANIKADKAVLPDGIKVVSDIPYIEKANAEQLLDVYYPENIKRTVPVIIYFHGGGFISGDKKQSRQFCMTLAKAGYAVFNVNYTLAPRKRNINQISDVLSAVKWVNENGSKYHGDIGRLVLAGNSAGAYLSAYTALLGTNEELAKNMNADTAFLKNKIKGVLLYNGIYDFRSGADTGFPLIKNFIGMFLGTNDIMGYEALSNLSVIQNLTGEYPKTFISSGEVDKLHSQSVRLIEELDRRRVLHEECLFDDKEKNANHDYHLILDFDTSKQCLKRTLNFLETVLKDNYPLLTMYNTLWTQPC